MVLYRSRNPAIKFSSYVCLLIDPTFNVVCMIVCVHRNSYRRDSNKYLYDGERVFHYINGARLLVAFLIPISIQCRRDSDASNLYFFRNPSFPCIVMLWENNP